MIKYEILCYIILLGSSVIVGSLCEYFSGREFKKNMFDDKPQRRDCCQWLLYKCRQIELVSFKNQAKQLKRVKTEDSVRISGWKYKLYFASGTILLSSIAGVSWITPNATRKNSIVMILFGMGIECVHILINIFKCSFHYDVSLEQGMNDGLVGPTLPDLALVTDTTPEKMSVLFTWRACLSIVGSLLTGQVLDRVDGAVVMATVLLLQAIPAAVTPWIPHMVALCAVNGLSSFFVAGVNTGKLFTLCCTSSDYMVAHYCNSQ